MVRSDILKFSVSQKERYIEDLFNAFLKGSHTKGKKEENDN